MTIFEQVINPADIQMYMQPLLISFSPLISAIITIGLFYCFLPKIKFFSHSVEKEAYMTAILAAMILGGVILVTIATLVVNSFRIIEPLRVPVFEELNNNKLDGKIFNLSREIIVQNPDKPSFIDKYQDDINTAINSELNEYHIPECELTKPEKYKTSLLCGGYSLDRTPAVKKDTDETYMLTPELNYDRSNSTVQLTIKEEKGYKK